MENQKILLREIMNLGVVYLLFVTVLYYFFVTYDEVNATKIFVQVSTGIGFLFILYWIFSLKALRGKISDNFIESFRLSFVFLALSIISIGLLISGNVSSMIAGRIILGLVFFSVLYPAVLPTFYITHLFSVEITNLLKHLIHNKRMNKPNKMVMAGSILSSIGTFLLILVLLIMLYFKIFYGVFEWNFIFLVFTYVLFVVSMPIVTAYSNRLSKEKLNESEKLLHLKMNQALTYSIFGFGAGVTFVFNGLDAGHLYNTIMGIIILGLAFLYLTVGYERRFAILNKKYSKEKPLEY